MATIERRALPPPNSTATTITEADRAELIARANDVIDYYLNGPGSYFDAGTRKPLANEFGNDTVTDLKNFRANVVASTQFADDPHSIMQSVLKLVDDAIYQVNTAAQNKEGRDDILHPLPDTNDQISRPQIAGAATRPISSVGPADPIYGGPRADADESSPQPPIRRLVGQIVDDPRTSAFDAGAPAAPSASNGFLFPDHADSFGDRLGNWTSSAAGISPDNMNQSLPPRQTGDGGILKYYSNSPAQPPAGGPGDAFSPLIPGPQQLQGTAPPYTDEYLQYLNRVNGINSPAPLFNPTNPPPLFAPSDYSTAFGSSSVEKWIASLSGADPDDPTPFAMPAMFNPYLGR
jgi:hypothetical protein